MPLSLDGVIFDQIMPDNSGGAVLDADKDGTATQEDEFVSFQNTTNADIDISGWQIWSVSDGYGAPDQAKTGLVHEFEPGTVLEGGETLWVLSEITGDLHWAEEASEGGVEAVGGGSNLMTEGMADSTSESVALVNPDTGKFIVFNMSPTPADYSELASIGFPGTIELGQIDGDSVQDDPGGGFSYQYDPSTDSYIYKAAWVPCFVAGSLIDTPNGPRPVEDIKAGDLVSTIDGGPQVVLWTRCRDVDLTNLENKVHAPVEFKPGSLGPCLPETPFAVSPQHRLLMVNQEGNEVLVPAIGLLSRSHVRRKAGMKSVRYHHLLLDHHAILSVHGVAAESLLATENLLREVTGADRKTLLHHFPERAPLPSPARPILSVKETKVAREWQLRPAGFVQKQRQMAG
ncbi:Hint domain-containing protein [uncultured Shimia sp.]|uniref:Hint domain-containing protein n=1 Tax=uncultured Shimia sp. TaxID=573152 RepID=UPI0026215835|nr:Hint domain-containing protein [uncultured Shimia sp.]